jgi:glycosyltransferase involved in cell wall biosynthesis
MTEFLQAVPVLAKQTNVVIVGSSGSGGQYDDWARRLDEEHSSVTWMGHLSDDHLLHSLWAHAGVYFHGHSVGGTNPALVQAMACGAPIVARESRFNREVLGTSGRFAAPEPQAIVKEVAAVLNRPAVQKSLSEAARQRAERSYSWPDVLRSYLNCLEEAVETKRAGERAVAGRL